MVVTFLSFLQSHSDASLRFLSDHLDFNGHYRQVGSSFASPQPLSGPDQTRSSIESASSVLKSYPVSSSRLSQANLTRISRNMATFPPLPPNCVSAAYPGTAVCSVSGVGSGALPAKELNQARRTLSGSLSRLSSDRQSVPRLPGAHLLSSASNLHSIHVPIVKTGDYTNQSGIPTATIGDVALAVNEGDVGRISGNAGMPRGLCGRMAGGPFGDDGSDS